MDEEGKKKEINITYFTFMCKRYWASRLRMTDLLIVRQRDKETGRDKVCVYCECKRYLECSPLKEIERECKRKRFYFYVNVDGMERQRQRDKNKERQTARQKEAHTENERV